MHKRIFEEMRKCCVVKFKIAFTTKFPPLSCSVFSNTMAWKPLKVAFVVLKVCRVELPYQ